MEKINSDFSGISIVLPQQKISAEWGLELFKQPSYICVHIYITFWNT